MFEYAFNQQVEHRACIESLDRYSTMQYGKPSSILVYKTEHVVRVENSTGFEFQTKSVYLTAERGVAVKDLVDGQVVKSVKDVCDVFGEFMYRELQFN